MCGGLSHSVLSCFSHFRSLVGIGTLDEFSPLISVLCVHSPCYLVFRGVFSLECSQLNVGLHSAFWKGEGDLFQSTLCAVLT